MPGLFIFTAGTSVSEGHTSGNVDAIGDRSHKHRVLASHVGAPAPLWWHSPKRPPPIPEERSPGSRAASIWTKK